MSNLSFVASCEIDLTEAELSKLNSLSKQLGIDLPATVRKCMTEKCDDYLEMLKQEPSVSA